MRQRILPNAVVLSALVVIGTGADGVPAGDGPWEGALRYAVTNGGGEPAADMPNLGIFVRRSVGERWRFAAALDKVEFDFEGPANYLGLEQDFDQLKTVDAKVQGFMVSGWAERAFGRKAARFGWFVRGGIGFSSTSADDARGPLVGGGSFDITTDTGLDIVPSVGAGMRWALGRSWGLELEARVDHHFADWSVEDRVSGAKATIGSFTAPGAGISVTRRF